jgi:hypothetical protein
MLRESEVQQAQVVLAAQAMSDDIQTMLEEVSSMQFKTLPRLIDEMKNQVGVDQAMQFNTDATEVLGTLVQTLQSSKQSMDQAIGVVTGDQSASMMGGEQGLGDEPGMDAEPELGDEPPLGDEPGMGGEPDFGDEPELDDEPDMGKAGLGRAKR